MNRKATVTCLLLIGLLAMLVLAACVPAQAPAAQAPATDAATPAATGAPRVFFVEPADGATVTAPVKVVMGAENFVVEAATDVAVAGHGHLHIMVDTDCVEAGQGIPKDDAHLHFGKGQLEAELELASGAHTLCLQAADGLHVALPGDGMSHTIALVVE